VGPTAPGTSQEKYWVGGCFQAFCSIWAESQKRKVCMEYYSTIKKNAILSVVAMGMEGENILLCEVSQALRDKTLHVLTYMQKLKELASQM
jgi:hypothetical protein